MSYTPRQLAIFRDIRGDIDLYLTRVIALPDLSARLRDAIEELELDDKPRTLAMLDCWTTLELIASTDDERNSLKEITRELTTLRELVKI